MKCPHCGASNRSKILKPLKETRSRYQPKRRSVSDENAPPNIILHQDCRSRLSGSIYSPKGYEVICEGCKCIFNCWTGNIDDGEYVAPIEKSAEEKRKEAILKVEDKKRNDELQWLQDLRNRLGKVGFCYEFRKQAWYARFGGTTWKLTDDDIEAIRNYTWDTPQTIVIKRTFEKRGIALVGAKSLFIFEENEQGRNNGE